MFAEDKPSVQVLQVLDVKNETIAGAKVQLAGTDRIYYTNLKGQCFIPAAILKASKGITVECISYKTQTIKSFETFSKIVLEFR